VVTLSATLAMGGMNTIVSEINAFVMPVPSTPDKAIANSTDGNA
jgi:hypothetical protein